MNAETHRQHFWQNHKKASESYSEWADRLSDHFVKWKKNREISAEEMNLSYREQFIAGLLEGITKGEGVKVVDRGS